MTLSTVYSSHPHQSEHSADSHSSPNIPTAWPPKASLFGIHVSTASCGAVCEAIITAAHRHEPAIVSAFSVHALVEAATERSLGDRVNRFAVIVADGQPVRWALNWLHQAGLKQNVRGSDLMWQLCRRAADEGLAIYLYGSTPSTLIRLESALRTAYPALEIAGAESPPFRALTETERQEMIARTNASGARLVFLGLGCPKQDYFAADHADTIQAVQVCVGAAFDFHAGTKPIAPEWMQRRGVEWLFRLWQEPKRLWKRYLVTNSQFVAMLLRALIQQRMLGRVPHSTSLGPDHAAAYAHSQVPLLDHE